MKTILGDFKWILAQFGDLVNLDLSGRLKGALVATWTGDRMKFFDTINLVWAKRRASDPFVPGLSALAARAAGGVGFGRLDDIG